MYPECASFTSNDFHGRQVQRKMASLDVLDMPKLMLGNTRRTIGARRSVTGWAEGSRQACGNPTLVSLSLRYRGTTRRNENPSLATAQIEETWRDYLGTREKETT